MENKLELVHGVPQEMAQEEQTVTVLDVINDCIGRLDTLTYNNEEVKKFGIVIGTVRDNLLVCANAMSIAERKATEEKLLKESVQELAEKCKANKEQEASEPVVSAEAIAEVKRYEEGVQDGNAEAK